MEHLPCRSRRVAGRGLRPRRHGGTLSAADEARTDPGRRRSPKGKGGQLRGEILAAAGRVLAEVGDTRRLTVRSVAAAAGVTPPALYLHFADKQALLRETLEEGFARFAVALDAGEGDGADPRSVLRARCWAYLAFAESNPGLYRVLFSVTSAGPGDIGVEAVGAHPGEASLETLVASVAVCLDRDDDPWPVVVALWSSLHGLADLRITKPEVPWPASAEVVDRVLTGLGLSGERR